MRVVKNINSSWLFTKEDIGVQKKIPSDLERIDLPHTWNANDGQDGGNDYYRGRCWYFKKLNTDDLMNDQQYLEIQGANSSADVYLNGKHLAHHDGGYSTFRIDLT
ncbi:MAG: hypothetical protein IJ875_04750, partial [Solobacterium sp.]|nr:hypothetical protein [Solobacterium sp.]